MSTTTATPTTPGRGVLILGREPAAWVGLIEAGLAVLFMLGGLRWVGLNTAEDVAVFMALVSAALAAYVAYATRDTSLAVVVGLVKSALALATVYGLHLGPDVAAAIIAFVSVGFAFFNRQATAPLADQVPRTVVRRDERGAVNTRTIAIIALVIAALVLLVLLL